MLKLTGEYDHIIDEKNRLFISNKLRGRIDVEMYGGEFFLIMGNNDILCLYPEKCFEEFVKVLSSKAAAPDEAIIIERKLYGQATQVEFDRQGRMLINDKLRAKANLGNQITVLGVRDHIEIWNTADWQRFSGDHAPAYEKYMEEARAAVFQKQSQNVGSSHNQEE